MVECLSCGRRQEPRLICADCGTPLSASLDSFAALGLPRQLSIDLAALERIYHDLSRKIHPDRFASRDTRVRDASLKATALLTRSYRTLRDPVSRGLYWLALNRAQLGTDNERVPLEIAELVCEVQEQVAELRAASGGAIETASIAAIGKRREELQALMKQANHELAANFARWDESAGDQNARAMLTIELK